MSSIVPWRPSVVCYRITRREVRQLNSRIARLVIGASVISAVAMTVLGQNRPYDQIMKEVGPAYANLKKNLDASAFAAAAQDAAKLEALFRETENFWTPFKTKD